jgi:hypothetical protein
MTMTYPPTINEINVKNNSQIDALERRWVDSRPSVITAHQRLKDAEAAEAAGEPWSSDVESWVTKMRLLKASVVEAKKYVTDTNDSAIAEYKRATSHMRRAVKNGPGLY